MLFSFLGGIGFSQLHENGVNVNMYEQTIPEDPCMEYLPTLTPKVI